MSGKKVALIVAILLCIRRRWVSQRSNGQKISDSKEYIVKGFFKIMYVWKKKNLI